jgi:hypothetical protein
LACHEQTHFHQYKLLVYLLYEAKARLGCKSRLDYQKVELFVKNNGDAKLSDIGAEFAISKGYS